jgi:protein-S-isoprenylcysteine O-methyltransferase Ste14
LYVLVASAQLALLCWAWKPLAVGQLWHTAGAMALALRAGSFLGWGLALLSTFLIDHLALFGVRADRPGGLRTPFLYRWVRHPLYLGILIGLWVTPIMTGGHLLLAAAMTAYILVGVHHEERDLVRVFGDDYRR